MLRLVLAVLIVSFVTASAVHADGAPEADDHAPVFDKRPYADAKKAAEVGKKWFIVKATAAWCAPCKQMDKTTWRDEKVVKWLETHAIAVALDVDEQKKISNDLEITAMPTMVAFKDGKEFDRIVGYKPAADFLAWLEGIAKGERSIEAVKRRAAAAPGDRTDVRAKMELARSLTQERKFVEAADEYVWLWKNMLEHAPSMSGVRVSFMASDMARLSKRDAAARAKFVVLRDETGKRLDSEKVDDEDVSDWIVLNNRVLNDTDATIKWFEKIKDQPRWLPVLRRSEYELTEMFIGLKRWADVGRLASDPLSDLDGDVEIMRLTADHKPPPGIDEEARKVIEETPRRMFREKTGQRYAGLLAAGKADLAGRFATKARGVDGSPEMIRSLVRFALEAEQVRPDHQAWLEGVKADWADDLRERVKVALAAKPERK